MTSLEKTIKVTDEFIDYRDARPFVDTARVETIARADCELYEWQMAKENLWEPGKNWMIDGVSDKYGKVDVKMIDKYWNLAPLKVRHIFRQRNDIDHYYFIEKVEWPDGPLIAGDKVTVRFLGVMTWDEVADSIEPSKYNGMYVDVRKRIKASSNLGQDEV